MEKDLLEVLRKKVGCAYISDLRTKEYHEKGIKAFEKIKGKRSEFTVCSKTSEEARFFRGYNRGLLCNLNKNISCFAQRKSFL